MKLPPSPLAALAVALLAAPPALAMDQRQADASCASWKLECPKGATAPTGPAKKAGVLECKAKGGAVKEGPSVSCKDGKALAWGDWKAGKKHGLQVTIRPNGSWIEELFAEGKQEGRSAEYSADGQLLKETYFQAGKKHGPERTFQVDGTLATEELWDKGVKGKKPAPTAAAKPKARAAAPAGETP
ncbi:MAG: toxin-antitoxin system YwqK family antitoxin [Hyalangium sp.]|uniref:toxin-antitoxin system YwqK family antitoxin n=1 Tax=Hyalangium sp. TaxID=2028555 RepID=UPI00389A5C5C